VRYPAYYSPIAFVPPRKLHGLLRLVGLYRNLKSIFDVARGSNLCLSKGTEAMKDFDLLKDLLECNSIMRNANALIAELLRG